MLRDLVLLGGVACALALGGCFSEGGRGREQAADEAGNADESPGLDDTPLWPDLDQPEAASAIRIADEGNVPVLEPLAVTDLAALFPESAQLVGVAIAPDTGRRYVLDARAGLYEIGDDGARLVFDLPASRVSGGTSDGAPPIELTDVAFEPYHSSLDGAPSFALTAENDGFLLSLPAGILTSHFCYFPPVTDWEATSTPSVSQELREQGIQVAERTEAVAVNESSGRIFAQPRTLRMDTRSVAGSELFVFDTTGGQPIGTRRFERSDFVAGGAAFLFQSSLVLGSGDGLYVSGGWANDALHVATVSGVVITGLASLPSGNLLVLDGPGKRLLELDPAGFRSAVSGI